MRYAWILLLLCACTPAPAPDEATAKPDAAATSDAAVADPASDDAAQAANPAAQAAPAAAMPATATLRGRVSYPSEELPAMRVCALDRSDPGRGACVRTEVNQPHYELAVPAGTWWLLAWPQDTGAAGDPGLLSEASECLQTGGVGCEDHALRDVEVAAGDVREGLDINDWYYDPQASPPPMAPAG